MPSPAGSADHLEISVEIFEAMVGHAVVGLPNEACGLFAGRSESARVERFFPMVNEAESAEIYRLPAQGMIDVEREVDASGLEVMGVMHSHTRTTNFPSPTDVADAERFDPFGTWRFVIVSLRHSDPSLRCYRMLDGDITELPVIIAR